MVAEHVLDRLVRREVVLAGRPWDTYMLSVSSGVVVGTAVVFALAFRSSVSVPVVALLVVLVAAFSLSLFKSTRILGRSHPLLAWAKKGVYHFQIGALILTIAVLELLREPVLPYLDVLVAGMIVYQVFGRLGCFMAGCCHGRPSSWGVRYGNKHAETGYLFFVQGVRLFPIQLVEALWLSVLAAGAIAIVAGDGEPGEAVSWYIVGYGAGRFAFEFFRGDTGRIMWRGFSEPQWTAMLLTALVTALGIAGVLPFHWWYVAVLVLMLCVVAALMVEGRPRRSALQLSDAERIRRSEVRILREANLLPGRLGIHRPRPRRSNS